MRKLTISIVNFNAGDYLVRCLKSIQDAKEEADIETVVFDNASWDSSIAQAKKNNFENVKYIQNDQNLGFGKAQNIVLRQVKNEYVLILNPDVELKPGVITTVLDYLEQDLKIGTISCAVILPDGSVDLTAHRGFPTLKASFLYYFLKDDSLYHLTNKNLNQPHEVDAISGSFMMIRNSVLKKVGLFDEDYFMYAEDIDLCFNIKKAGFKVMYLPQVEVIHYKGISSGLKKHSQKLSSATLETKLRSLDAFYETMKIFYRKHYASQHQNFINWLVYRAIDFKWWQAKRKLTV